MPNFINFKMEVFDLHLYFHSEAESLQLTFGQCNCLPLIGARELLTIKSQIMLMTISGWRIKEAWRLQSWFALTILSVFKGKALVENLLAKLPHKIICLFPFQCEPNNYLKCSKAQLYLLDTYSPH